MDLDEREDHHDVEVVRLQQTMELHETAAAEIERLFRIGHSLLCRGKAMSGQPTLWGDMPGRHPSHLRSLRVASVSTWWGGALAKQRTGIVC